MPASRAGACCLRGWSACADARRMAAPIRRMAARRPALWREPPRGGGARRPAAALRAAPRRSLGEPKEDFAQAKSGRLRPVTHGGKAPPRAAESGRAPCVWAGVQPELKGLPQRSYVGVPLAECPTAFSGTGRGFAPTAPPTRGRAGCAHSCGRSSTASPDRARPVANTRSDTSPKPAVSSPCSSVP